MVGKYILDVGWGKNYTVYNMYGKSGGSKDAVTTTEALCQGCRRDGARNLHCPKMWVGDFNATPCDLLTVREMIRDHQWTDVGHRDNWWRGKPDEWTCHSRAKAKKSRIDGVVVDCEVLSTIAKFEVEKNEQIPTHRVLRMALHRNPFQLKRTFLQKLGSLKKLCEEKIKEIVKEMEAKEAANKRQEEIEALKEKMDQSFRENRRDLDDAARKKDTDAFWKIWSRAVEDPYIKALELEEKEEKR